MGPPRIDRIAELLTSTEFIVGLLWAGLAVFSITLVVLMQTRWGQSRALGKCLVLSLLVHLLLVGYATTVRIVAGSVPEPESEVAVSFIDSDQSDSAGEKPTPREPRPWERFSRDTIAQPEARNPEREEVRQPVEPERQPRAERPNLPGDPSLENVATSEPAQPEPSPPEIEGASGLETAGKDPERIDAPKAERREAPRVDLPDRLELARRSEQTPQSEVDRRQSQPGVPAALVDEPVPLPRMDARATTPDPAEALAALTDRAEAAPQLRSSAADSAYLPETAGPLEDGDSASESTTGETAPGGREAVGQQVTGRGDKPPRELARVDRPASPEKVPEMYQLRVDPDREEKAERQGATDASERAVRAALKWLANNQSSDGRWRAARFGAGNEENVLGRNRYHAGSRADTGITGLALLAFLGAGHTHQDGPYREQVRRGLEFLLRQQAADGNLDGEATTYAKMYCHAMAAFAMSEAYGMTADKRLKEPVRRAIRYTVVSQNKTSGGWRYLPGDPGDTSQLGWQLMALKSAELAGIPTPPDTRDGMIRFLRSVSGGEHGGLSRYRPGERLSRPMTAEALASWQFLGMPREHPASEEAGDYILQEPPGSAEPNLYFWYYGTLSTYQLGGRHWQQWNEAIQTTLIDRQQKSGPNAGSWDPDTVWGGYGGRVYTTSLAALCLEVYYRFLPLYVEAAAEARR